MIVGTTHDPLAEVTDEPVSAFPLQLRLFAVAPSMPTLFIPGAAIRLEIANAGLIAAKSISEPTRNADSLVKVFIISSFFI